MSGVWKTSTMVLGLYMRSALLTALKTAAAAPVWPTPKIHLSQDPTFAPQSTDSNATLAVHEATFTGYVAQVPTFQVPVLLDHVTAGLITSVVFTCTGPAIANTLYGYWGDDGVNLYGAESRTQDPIAVGLNGDFVQVDFQLPIGPTEDNPALA